MKTKNKDEKIRRLQNKWIANEGNQKARKRIEKKIKNLERRITTP